MKRSDELAPLSRDHHQALVVALKLRRGDDAIEELFERWWTEHGRVHFAIEEELLRAELLPDDESWASLVARMTGEHRAIEALAERWRDARDDGDRGKLGQLLRDHVRFEENEQFPLLEERLEQPRLAELGARFAAHEDDAQRRG